MPTDFITTIDGTHWSRVTTAAQYVWLEQHGFPLVHWTDDPTRYFPKPGTIPAADAMRAAIAKARSKLQQADRAAGKQAHHAT